MEKRHTSRLLSVTSINNDIIESLSPDAIPISFAENKFKTQYNLKKSISNVSQYKNSPKLADGMSSLNAKD